MLYTNNVKEAFNYYVKGKEYALCELIAFSRMNHNEIKDYLYLIRTYDDYLLDEVRRAV